MNKVVLYTPEGGSLDEVLVLQRRAAQMGIQITECAAGGVWSEVLGQLDRGDELVVGSLDCFTSLNELLGFAAGSGVLVRSLSEEWFSQIPIIDPLAYQCKLYELSSSLHAARTRKGLAEAALVGHHPGRRRGSKAEVKSKDVLDVARVEVLRKEHGLSVVEACRQVGISVNGYYRKRK